MKKFIGVSLEDAIQKARLDFLCPEDELEYEVIIYPKRGFLGFGRQDAVILAQSKAPQSQSIETVEIAKKEKQEALQNSYSQIENNFFCEKISSTEIAQKLTQEINELFSFLPYQIDPIKVRIENDASAYVEILGRDCGLLIGEKGHRYYGLFHILSVWIKKDYGLGLHLEIADFLKNKERKVEEYLEENYEQIISRNSFQTQPFDALSTSIALRRFRDSICDRYIVAKPISETESVITINEFKKR